MRPDPTPIHSKPSYLEELAPGVHAYLQPPGTWGYGNAGMISDGRSTLLVDTLNDLHTTQVMIECLAPYVANAPVVGLVNTSGASDHCWGNQLIAGGDVEVISTREAWDDLQTSSPDGLHKVSKLQAILPRSMRRVAKALTGPFSFKDIRLAPPTRFVEAPEQYARLERDVHLIPLGNAQSPGMLAIWLPADKILFVGDTVLAGHTPGLSGSDRARSVGDRPLEGVGEGPSPFLGLLLEPPHRLGVGVAFAHLDLLQVRLGEFGVGAQNRRQDTQRGQNVRLGVVEVVCGQDAVMPAEVFQAPLAFAIAVHRAVEQVRVDDGEHLAAQPFDQRLEPVASQLRLQQGEVVGRVEGDGGPPGGHVLRQRRRDLLQYLADGPPLGARLGGGDPVDRRRALGDLHARIGEPVVLVHALRADQDDRARHEPVLLGADPGGLRIESDDALFTPHGAPR